ncbi:MAG: site-2 protease family protein [Planctomycetota bacterium]
MGFDLFISNLFSDNANDRFFFFCVVITVVVSIVLHELAHGWMAIRLGDDTPIRMDRMTGNPLVHMGPFSLLALALAGIAWGQMPIDPSRLKGKYGGSKVALAGPAMNLLLAVVTLLAYALWLRFGGFADPGTVAGNGQAFLQIAGITNLLLMCFNLMPIPPLDGSHVASDLFAGYQRFVSDPANSGALMLGFFFAFAMSQPLMMVCSRAAAAVIGFVITVGT